VGLLKKAIYNSQKKGYHTDGMDFGRVHRSGVSNILLKGQSYSVNPGIRSIKLDQVWRYEGETKFLDASLLAYNFNDKHLYTVDFCHRACPDGAITHSGDKMGAAGANSCRHTIDVDMRKLPKTIKYLYVVLSSYAGALLSEIIQPSVNLFDSSNANDSAQLCAYELEDKDTKARTSVLMCRMARDTPSAAWKMEAIGSMGAGSANNYSAIQSAIVLHMKKSTAV
jgi:stress response protein SCP2